MGDRDEFARVADQLSDVLIAIEEVDLNVLVDGDVRELLDAKEEIQRMCEACRQNQHALRDLEEGESP